MDRIHAGIRDEDFRGLYRWSRALDGTDGLSDVLQTYLDLRLAFVHRIFADVADAGERLLRNDALRTLLGVARLNEITQRQATALIRLGRHDEAIGLLMTGTFTDDAALALALVDAHVVEQPAKAVSLLAGLAQCGLLPIRHRVLLADLLTAQGRCNDALACLDRLAAATNDHAADILIARSNALGRLGRVLESCLALQQVYDLYGLCAPRIAPGAPFRLANIVDVPERPAREGPLVSVIMTAFDAAGTIERAASSILAQRYRNFELIIVDDVSQDSTAQRIRELVRADPRVKAIFNKSNVGTYVSKNTAIGVSSGSFLTFLDSDDWAHPDRLRCHVEAMLREPNIVATRSRWLRIGEDGRIPLKRWSKSYLHADPASMMVRASALREIGLFDTVRSAADTELWTRFVTRYGRKRLHILPEPLGLGLLHEQSLTRAGAAALNEEDYSETRELYRRSWLAWHRSHDDPSAIRLAGKERCFSAPDDIMSEQPHKQGIIGVFQRPCFDTVPPPRPAASPRERVVHVGIALACAGIGRWPQTCRLLAGTLRSLFNQSDGRFRVLLCCHDVPPIKELADRRIEILPCHAPRPRDRDAYRPDKKRKQRVIAAHLRRIGGGYLIPLDADDRVNRDVVRHVLADDNRRGYAFTTGYALDWRSGTLAPVPGAWDASFDNVCGSSAVLALRPDDLPATAEEHGSTPFDLLVRHAFARVVAQERGRPLAALPFPGAVYVLNHSQNMSFSLQRQANRQRHIVESIKRHRVPLTPELARSFSLDPSELGQTDHDVPILTSERGPRKAGARPSSHEPADASASQGGSIMSDFE